MEDQNPYRSPQSESNIDPTSAPTAALRWLSVRNMLALACYLVAMLMAVPIVIAATVFVSRRQLPPDDVKLGILLLLTGGMGACVAGWATHKRRNRVMLTGIAVTLLASLLLEAISFW
jgi:hypothetical protein